MTSRITSSRFQAWAELSSPDLQALIAEDPVVVLPLGAIEQHGPHLPLSTDLDIVLALLAAAALHYQSTQPVLTLPPLSVGVSPEHQAFAGTLSLQPETAQAVVMQYIQGVAQAGGRRVVLLNSHGGNVALMNSVALQLRQRYGLLVVKCSYPQLPRPEMPEWPETEWRYGLHGGALETALMLAIAPTRVQCRHCRPAVSLAVWLQENLHYLAPGGPVSFAWMAQDLHPSGVVGRPDLATTEQGERLVRHYAQAIARVLEDTAAFPLSALQDTPDRGTSGA